MYKRLFLLLLCCILQTAYAEEDISTESALAQDINDLKEQVIALNRDLFILQEELLFPAETQVAVFLSIDSGSFFNLDSVEIIIDKKPVQFHLYTEHQRQALERGGIQKIWIGNIKQGEHEIVVHFKGLTYKQRAIERATSLNFEKTDEPAMLEIRIVDATQDMRPHFSIKQWQE